MIGAKVKGGVIAPKILSLVRSGTVEAGDLEVTEFLVGKKREDPQNSEFAALFCCMHSFFLTLPFVVTNSVCCSWWGSSDSVRETAPMSKAASKTGSRFVISMFVASRLNQEIGRHLIFRTVDNNCKKGQEVIQDIDEDL